MSEADLIFQRLANNDGSAVGDCVNKYGGWVWRIATAFSDSKENAESITCEIFEAIWKNARRFHDIGLDEKALIAMIIRTELQFRPDSLSIKRRRSNPPFNDSGGLASGELREPGSCQAIPNPQDLAEC